MWGRDLLFPLLFTKWGSSLQHLLKTLAVRSGAKYCAADVMNATSTELGRQLASLSGVRKLMCNRACLRDIFVQKSSISVWYRLASGCSPESLCVQSRDLLFEKRQWWPVRSEFGQPPNWKGSGGEFPYIANLNKPIYVASCIPLKTMWNWRVILPNLEDG